MSEKNDWDLLDDAILFATEKHHGQIDKSGRPYILHPLRVMQSFKEPHMKIIAVLHDVMEDCGVKFEEIEERFNYGIALHVDYLTKLKSQSLEEYLSGVKLYESALKVKLKDIEDNMSVFRLSLLPKEMAEKMTKKYLYCLEFLNKEK
jgi:(p)ppGpp synthase/HD superfamily hydrolase